MNAFTRKLGLAFVTMGLLGVTGCGDANEADGKAASAKLGDPGTADAKGLPANSVTPPKTNADRGSMGAQGSSLNMGKDKAKTK